MTRENRGKKFEEIIKKSFLAVPNVSVDRIHDQMTGFKVTSANICDFIVYKKPHEYYIECKSVHGASLPFSNITENQWNGLLEKSKINGVFAGIICWFIDKDKTYYIPIQRFESEREYCHSKSLGIRNLYEDEFIEIVGKKKRVFFEYDMSKFFEEMENR